MVAFDRKERVPTLTEESKKALEAYIERLRPPVEARSASLQEVYEFVLCRAMLNADELGWPLLTAGDSWYRCIDSMGSFYQGTLPSEDEQKDTYMSAFMAVKKALQK